MHKCRDADVATERTVSGTVRRTAEPRYNTVPPPYHGGTLLRPRHHDTLHGRELARPPTTWCVCGVPHACQPLPALGRATYLIFSPRPACTSTITARRINGLWPIEYSFNIICDQTFEFRKLLLLLLSVEWFSTNLVRAVESCIAAGVANHCIRQRNYF